jgi:two-component system nitrate/nitrite response regulator NarL
VVRIMLADDHVLFRQVVREIVEKEHDLEVVAEASNGQEAVQRAGETQPDVVLLDLAMPVCDGLQAIEQILACSPGSHVVIFSASAEEQQVLRALQCGAIGYITKDMGAEELLIAIRRAIQNELYMAHSPSARLLALLRTLKPPSSPKPSPPRHTSASSRKSAPVSSRKSKRNLPLTEREREVLDLIRLGQRNKEIARELRIAESTVHKHVQHIFEKLDARNRAEALFLVKM